MSKLTAAILFAIVACAFGVDVTPHYGGLSSRYFLKAQAFGLGLGSPIGLGGYGVNTMGLGGLGYRGVGVNTLGLGGYGLGLPQNIIGLRDLSSARTLVVDGRDNARRAYGIY